MLKIDRLILRLPPEFSGREKTLGLALARALADTQGFSRTQSFKSISATVPSTQISHSDASAAQQIAAHVHTRIAAELGRSRS